MEEGPLYLRSTIDLNPASSSLKSSLSLKEEKYWYPDPRLKDESLMILLMSNKNRASIPLKWGLWVYREKFLLVLPRYKFSSFLHVCRIIFRAFKFFS